ncbi:MAG: Hsp20/alpha crystallin family protein [Flavobacteriaceae bacterium]|nr:Hsp20/alpha crystallin family protein [Bacteroidia bacterium]MBT8288725.1 Hsp20/alpha crystallin family protein [Bacteroidia bacterium]NNF73770.1 Hsp20/alpha crystallin family protein [Flavobacteriaceae bacterium]NNK74288.1 Hsp20/alpha crystallin family protein [Flavobacteriaceae bacterium]
MSLIKFDKKRRPWFPTELSNFFGDDDFLNDRFWHRYVQNEPAMNVKETEGEYQVELAAPGLEKDDFEISIDDGYLIVKAEKSFEKEDKEDNFTRREFSYNSFRRSLMLPEDVKEEEIKASYENGVLKFNLSKKELTEVKHPKKIEIE